MYKYEYYLEPQIVDRRKSFYRKAKVIVDNEGNEILQSYNTYVAGIKNNIPYIEDWFSATTRRHIYEFMAQHGITGTKKELEKFLV